MVFDIRFMSTIQFHPRFFCTLYFLFESASAFTNIRRMNNYCFIWPWKYLLTTHGSQQKHLRNKNNFCFGFCGEVCFCVLYIFFQSWMSPQNVSGWVVPIDYCQSRSVFRGYILNGYDRCKYDATISSVPKETRIFYPYIVHWHISTIKSLIFY